LADVRTVFRFALFFEVFFADDLIGFLIRAPRLLKNKINAVTHTLRESKLIRISISCDKTRHQPRPITTGDNIKKSHFPQAMHFTGESECQARSWRMPSAAPSRTAWLTPFKTSESLLRQNSPSEALSSPAHVDVGLRMTATAPPPR
jgi:hypothetical protein